MMGRVIACALVAVAAGQQVRDNAPVPIGTSTIAGRVMVDGTPKQPARRVRVAS